MSLRRVTGQMCETWSLTLREQRKLRVFENMVLRRIEGRGNGGMEEIA